MPRTLSGLQTGEFDEIDVLHSVKINMSPGEAGQVLTSDGNYTNWDVVAEQLPATTDADEDKVLKIDSAGQKVFTDSVTLDTLAATTLDVSGDTALINLQVSNTPLFISGLNGNQISNGTI
eukprot:SAG22_NODE_3873_length_1487_cov_221.814841_4_plen_120_part_01